MAARENLPMGLGAGSGGPPKALSAPPKRIIAPAPKSKPCTFAAHNFHFFNFFFFVYAFAIDF